MSKGQIFEYTEMIELMEAIKEKLGKYQGKLDKGFPYPMLNGTRQIRYNMWHLAIAYNKIERMFHFRGEGT